MKKHILYPLFLITLLSSISLSSFSQAYKEGDKLLNATIGLNSAYSSGIPLGASFEVGVSKDISVGGSLDYTSFKYDALDYGWNFLYFGARGSYHVNELLKVKNDKLDLYGGLGLGYYTASFSGLGGTYAGAYSSSLYLTGFIGGRYYFAQNVGGVLELGGGGVSNVKLGVTFKF